MAPSTEAATVAHIAFKSAFTLTTHEQGSLLEQCFGTARFAYNWALTAWEEERTAGRRSTFQSLRNKLNEIKREAFPWMLLVPKDVPAEAIRDLTVAFKNFFEGGSGKGRKAKYPRRKKKGRSKFSFRLPGDRLRFRESTTPEGIITTEVYLSKIGWVRLREHFLAVGKVLYATVSRKVDRYFISFCMEYQPTKRVRKIRHLKSTAIDLGLTHTLTLANGVKIEGPRASAKHQRKLRRANRRLHARVKGSRNRARQARKVAAVHQRIANIRRDFTEKTTTQLLQRHDVIGIEDLNVAAMIKSGRASRSFSDASFGAISAALVRKAPRFGVLVIKIDRFFPSSKQCRLCGCKNQALTLADRIFQCPEVGCGHREDRDVHAARNVHREALARVPRATGEFTPVEIWSLPSGFSSPVGKSNRRSRKRAPRGPMMSNTGQRQNPVESDLIYGQV